MKAALTILFRSPFPALPPRAIKLPIPGWAGKNHLRCEGAETQPWHCQPFVDGATYGLELIYPFKSECRVRKWRKSIVFEADFSKEPNWVVDSDGRPYVPFSAFAPGHYGMTTCLDIQAPRDHFLRIEPHPRYYSEQSNEVPLAVPAHIERFWPQILFAVFKSPVSGQAHVFREGEPYAQILVLPRNRRYVAKEMSLEESRQRSKRDHKIAQAANFLATHLWRAKSGDCFDDKYRRLNRVFREGGLAAVNKLIDTAHVNIPRVKAKGN
jgi:hypothetical protein